MEVDAELDRWAGSTVCPRRFVLRRSVDVTGVSGTGDVAEGVEWSDGTVALRWRGRWATTVVWDYGLDALLAVHGHNGSTVVRWLDGDRPT